MKGRLIALFFLAGLAFSLSGCGGNSGNVSAGMQNDLFQEIRKLDSLNTELDSTALSIQEKRQELEDALQILNN